MVTGRARMNGRFLCAKGACLFSASAGGSSCTSCPAGTYNGATGAIDAAILFGLGKATANASGRYLWRKDVLSFFLRPCPHLSPHFFLILISESFLEQSPRSLIFSPRIPFSHSQSCNSRRVKYGNIHLSLRIKLLLALLLRGRAS